MGGIFSTVADLARWVGRLRRRLPGRATARTTAAPAGPGGPAGDAAPAAGHRRLAGRVATPTPATLSYGFGLFVEEDPAFGTIVQHSGGYPGFGSQMRWHPATGTGVDRARQRDLRARGRAGRRDRCPTLLRRQLRAGAAGGRGAAVAAARRPATAARGRRPLAAREQTPTGCCSDWDDELAAAAVHPERGLGPAAGAARREAIARIRERIGDFAPDPARPAEFDTPAHCRWWLTGERGSVQAEIALAPLSSPRVQSLRMAVPPAPGSVVLRMLDALIGIINDAPAQWPAWLPAAADVDTAQLARRLRLATAWAGRCSAGAFRSGDGESTATVELDGGPARPC